MFDLMKQKFTKQAFDLDINNNRDYAGECSLLERPHFNIKQQMTKKTCNNVQKIKISFYLDLWPQY